MKSVGRCFFKAAVFKYALKLMPSGAVKGIAKTFAMVVSTALSVCSQHVCARKAADTFLFTWPQRQ